MLPPEQPSNQRRLSLEEAERIVDEILAEAEGDTDSPPTLLNFSFGSKFHKESMEEYCPEVAARMPLEEQRLFCTRCGHRDNRWYGDFCPLCGQKAGHAKPAQEGPSR